MNWVLITGQSSHSHSPGLGYARQGTTIGGTQHTPSRAASIIFESHVSAQDMSLRFDLLSPWQDIQCARRGRLSMPEEDRWSILSRERSVEVGMSSSEHTSSKNDLQIRDLVAAG